MSAALRIAVRMFAPFESAILRQFEDFARRSHMDARIEIEVLDLNPLHERLFAQDALASGAVDIAFLPTDWVAQAQQAGIIADLKPHIAKAPIPDFPGAWSPSLLELQSFAGGFWGMPYHDGPQCLIYRKDLFAQAGLSPPKTWDQFVAAARRLHAPDQGRFGTVLALFPDGHNGFYDFCVHVWTRGGEPFDASGRPKLVTGQAVAALDFVRALAADASAVAPHPERLDSVASGLMFCEGKVALMTNWFGFAALGEADDSPVKGMIDIAPLPAGAGGRSVSLNVFWMLALASGSRNPALAWDFMRHVASPAMDRLTTTEGAIGTRRSTWADPEINARIPYCSKLAALHECARQMPRRANLSRFAGIIDEMLQRALTTALSSSQLLMEAQHAIEGIPE
jgi:multiple sugar transport system substrate-binding protein